TYQNQFYLLPYIYLPNNLDQKPLFFSSKSFFSSSCIFVSFSFRTSVFASMSFVLVASSSKRLDCSVLANCCSCDSSLCNSETSSSFESSLFCKSCTWAFNVVIYSSLLIESSDEVLLTSLSFFSSAKNVSIS